MALETQYLQDQLLEQFNTDVTGFGTGPDNILSFEVNATRNEEIIRFLKEDATLRFNFLTDVCGVHYPEATEDRQFAVVYHLHNWIDNKRIRIKCFLHGKNPEIQTITGLFPGANWQERETYDFFGIIFKGHPQLKRILNMDEMVSFPMRKEYPMEDAGRTDKDDRFFGRAEIYRNN